MSNPKYLLPKVSKYFKTNLHTHTNITDGSLSPEEMKEIYKAKGYSILSITDHNVIMDLSHLNEEDFLMLTGAEYNVNEPGWADRRFWVKTYHLNFIAKKPNILWQPFMPGHPKDTALPYLEKIESSNIPWEYDLDRINEMIAEGNRRGFLVMYNHPNWSMQDYNEYISLKGLWAMELINFDASRNGNADRDNSRIYNDMINSGMHIFPVGADDAHAAASACGAWIMVGAKKLEYDSVIEALEKGDFYTSNGPEIYELSIKDKKLHIECSDAQHVMLESGTRFSKRVSPKAPDKLLRSADFDLAKWIDGCTEENNRNWIRITVQGPYGNFAATRAFWLEELK